MKKLPIGIQSFSEIRTDNYCYVDKTRLIHRLVDEGKFYFFSRPRRFGKSLLLDTIAHAFSGNRELFSGLYLEKHWNWKDCFPVIRIDFAAGILRSREQLDVSIMEMLDSAAEQNSFTLQYRQTHLAFSELLRKLHKKTDCQIVVLIDEYDKPILDNITDPEIARELRDGLRNFYSVLKSQSPLLRFVMLTGVSKFSKVSLFSGLNNLIDITLDRTFGNLCGYTQPELETVFHEHLDGIDLEQVRIWYNGYNFLADPVYNPFDVLLYLRNRVFRPYWFETGTPTFLVDLIHARKLSAPSLENIQITDVSMASFDVDAIEPEPLLFQTGYLTILKEEQYPGGYFYTLGFPNHEVRHAFNNALLTRLTQTGTRQDDKKLALMRILQRNELDKLADLFHAFFASIPNDWYRKNSIADYEGYYCSVVYCYFTALGLDVRAEQPTNQGRLDMVVHFQGRVYILEFKVNELTKPGRALDQIKEKKYYEPYKDRETYLIGVEFSRDERNITRFEWELLEK